MGKCLPDHSDCTCYDANRESILGMDTECELATAITAYIWRREQSLGQHVNLHHSHTLENGEYGYIEEAQGIFNSVLDIISTETGVGN